MFYASVDIAIKQLRPKARFSLYNKEFIFWEDPDGLDPPSWEEIQSVVARHEKQKQQWEDYIKNNHNP